MNRGAQRRRLIAGARECNHCLCWLKYCEAECCKGFQCPRRPHGETTVTDGMLKISVPMNPDKKWYFQLHGIGVEGDVLSIPTRSCRFYPQVVAVSARCALLTEDNLCAGHPDLKPEICKGYTLETTRQALPMGCEDFEEGYRLTPNCLFNYKK